MNWVLIKLVLSESPAMQFWDLKMPKMALADCSGVCDAVICQDSSRRTRMAPELGRTGLGIVEVDMKRSTSVFQDKLNKKVNHNKAYHQNGE